MCPEKDDRKEKVRKKRRCSTHFLLALLTDIFKRICSTLLRDSSVFEIIRALLKTTTTNSLIIHDTVTMERGVRQGREQHWRKMPSQWLGSGCRGEGTKAKTARAAVVSPVGRLDGRAFEGDPRERERVKAPASWFGSTNPICIPLLT